jgi:hypothetical protein
LSENHKGKGKTGDQCGRRGSGDKTEGAGESNDWMDNAEFVIDEYWDDKFGFQFGVLDWRSLGLGC